MIAARFSKSAVPVLDQKRKPYEVRRSHPAVLAMSFDHSLLPRCMVAQRAAMPEMALGTLIAHSFTPPVKKDVRATSQYVKRGLSKYGAPFMVG